MEAKKILKDLVAINTIADKDNNRIMDYIDSFLSNLGFEIERKKNAETGKEVLIGKYGENPAIGFLGHTDTVDITDGWTTDPHELTEKDGVLYGLGACDMKGGIAAFLSAISETDRFENFKSSRAFSIFSLIKYLLGTSPVTSLNLCENLLWLNAHIFAYGSELYGMSKLMFISIITRSMSLTSCTVCMCLESKVRR